MWCVWVVLHIIHCSMRLIIGMIYMWYDCKPVNPFILRKNQICVSLTCVCRRWSSTLANPCWTRSRSEFSLLTRYTRVWTICANCGAICRGRAYNTYRKWFGVWCRTVRSGGAVYAFCFVEWRICTSTAIICTRCGLNWLCLLRLRRSWSYCFHHWLWKGTHF